MKRMSWFCVAAALFLIVQSSTAATAAGTGDAERGARIFRACAACHSLRPSDHRTGPSLSGILGRTAGTQRDFARYSEALAGSGLVWSADTLDAWIADPQALVPGNRMTFAGIESDDERADLIAYLEAATGSQQTAQNASPGRDLHDLKTLGPTQQVAAIAYCGDTYRVTTADGERYPFWEFNLRFKTDSSARGPALGHPVLLGAGMMGDRAVVIFAGPEEIGRFIARQC